MKRKAPQQTFISKYCIDIQGTCYMFGSLLEARESVTQDNWNQIYIATYKCELGTVFNISPTDINAK